MSLFCWGSNSKGQLGVGDNVDYHKIMEIKIQISIKKITGGGSHSAILSDDGYVLTTGSNKYHQLCRQTQSSSDNNFQKISFPFKIKNICCGWDSTCLVSEENYIFIYGNSFCHQLNGFNKYSDDPIISQCRFVFGPFSPISDISIGESHVLFCTSSGSLYVLGCGRKGQLGLGINMLTLDRPTEVLIYPGCVVTKVICGWDFSLCLTNKNELFGWGNNSYGQCGIPSNKHKNIFKPMNIHLVDGNIKSIACGWSHVVVLFYNGKVICWGRNDFGQCGRNIHPCHPDYLEFSPLSTISSIICGAEHSLFLSETCDRLFSCGWNEHGSCATEKDVFVRQPISYDLKIFKNTTFSLGTGYSHSFLFETRHRL